MPDNRFVPAAHFAEAPEGEVSAPDQGVASASSELRGGGPRGPAAADAGGDAPAARRGDPAVAADPQVKNAAAMPPNASH